VPKGPKNQKRPADVTSNTHVLVRRIRELVDKPNHYPVSGELLVEHVLDFDIRATIRSKRHAHLRPQRNQGDLKAANASRGWPR
jgi:hypothetical protein